MESSFVERGRIHEDGPVLPTLVNGELVDQLIPLRRGMVMPATMSPTITKGELLTLLAKLPGDTPLMAYDLSRAISMDLHLTAEDVRFLIKAEASSIALDADDLPLGSDPARSSPINKEVLIALLADVPDDMPLIAYSWARGDYMNLALPADSLMEQYYEPGDAVVLLAHDNYDTRQW